MKKFAYHAVYSIHTYSIHIHTRNTYIYTHTHTHRFIHNTLSVTSSMRTRESTMEHVITSFMIPYATGSSLYDWPHTRPSCSVAQIIFHTCLVEQYTDLELVYMVLCCKCTFNWYDIA